MATPAALSSLDPSGTPYTQLTPELLRTQRTSIKWTRYPADVLPLFIAEMDFTVAPEIQNTIIDRVRASDTGYLDGSGPLAKAFADFAEENWQWTIAPERVFLATDVSCGVVEPLRLSVPVGGRIALSTPTYPGFFEMLSELDAAVVEIPLSITHANVADTLTSRAKLDLTAIEAEFASTPGIDAFVLCNPHNPHGLVHTAEDLAELARLAARYDVFVVSDEIHAPLTHQHAQFVPFAPLAAAAGALAVTATSASKGWNLAGLKCSVVVAADDRAKSLLEKLPPEVACRASILGLHANVTAFRDARPWLARAIAQIEAHSAFLAQLVSEQLPGVRYSVPDAGYLAWLDFSDTPLAQPLPGAALGSQADVHGRILNEARVALGNGAWFGTGGTHHVRVNLAVAPDTLREGIARISRLLNSVSS